MDSELTLLRLMPPGFCALTGAGSGTSAGIPDYRDESGRWKHAAEPLTYGAFVGDTAVPRLLHALAPPAPLTSPFQSLSPSSDSAQPGAAPR